MAARSRHSRLASSIYTLPCQPEFQKCRPALVRLVADRLAVAPGLGSPSHWPRLACARTCAASPALCGRSDLPSGVMGVCSTCFTARPSGATNWPLSGLAWCYHFWMAGMKPLKRRSGNQHVHKETGNYRQSVRRKLAAYHCFLQMGVIAQGLLQMLAILYPDTVWRFGGCWMRIQSSSGGGCFSARSSLTPWIKMPFLCSTPCSRDDKILR